MRVVLDTNVLARAFVSGAGPAAECQRLLLRPPHVLVTSAAILAELERVLAYPRMRALHQRSDEEIARAVTDLATVAEVVDLRIGEESPVVRRDSDDEWVVATALAGSASVLCSRDRHFYEADVVAFCNDRGVRIMGDLELLAELRASDGAVH